MYTWLDVLFSGLCPAGGMNVLFRRIRCCTYYSGESGILSCGIRQSSIAFCRNCTPNLQCITAAACCPCCTYIMYSWTDVIRYLVIFNSSICTILAFGGSLVLRSLFFQAVFSDCRPKFCRNIYVHVGPLLLLSLIHI